MGTKNRARVSRARIKGGAITLKSIRHPHLPESWLHQRLKLSHRHHTAKVLPRHHTSYGILLLMLLLSGWMVLILGSSALAGPPQSQSGSINVGGEVVRVPPSVPAVITQPDDGQVFIANPIIVKGTCPTDTFVEVHRNGILAGTTSCNVNVFELSIDLVNGVNELIARVSDQFNQYGPDSVVVKVTYNPPATTSNPGASGSGGSSIASSPASVGTPQLLLSTDTSYKGVITGQSLTIKLRISGGQPPYALVMNWGDEKQDIVSRAEAGEFEIKHRYEAGGNYTIKANASDKAGRKAFLQTVIIIVGGTTGSVSSTPIIRYVPQLYVVAWPLYILLICMTAMFWLGERYEFYHLKKIKTQFR